MSESAIEPPKFDPTSIFEAFRGMYATQLLTAAVAEFGLFDQMAARGAVVETGCGVTFDELRSELGLERRPARVLVTALLAMGLLEQPNSSAGDHANADAESTLYLSPLAAEHLVSGGRFDVSDYLRLAKDDPGVREMIARLKTNRPANAEAEQGAAFIFRDGLESAMEQEATARFFTLALAGRAKNVAPRLADVAPLAGTRRLLDVGGGTGIYSISLVQKHPGLRAVVLDRPEVLKVAAELVASHGVADRVELMAADMFADRWPADCDAVLLSNVLHDWDELQCAELIRRSAEALPAGGRLLIHDVFLTDALDGPLPIALYSAALFTLTEGRAYSRAEYAAWMRDAGLVPGDVLPTLIHCGVLAGLKSPA